MSRGARPPAILGPPAPLNWFGIIRLGLVQAALGSVIVLITSTLNRVMVVEYALPAVLPGALVALHYAVQLVRPRFGFQSDRGARQTPWILAGMLVLAVGGVLCATACVLMPSHRLAGLALAVMAYAMVGLGVGAAGTPLLVLLANRVDGQQRAAAATIMWILMIAGFAITSAILGRVLTPFSPLRLMFAAVGVAAGAFVIAALALGSVERRTERSGITPSLARRALPSRGRPAAIVSFSDALRSTWREPRARYFTSFIFISMLAYSAQELLIEPFAGLVFGYSVGASAKLSASWHGAALVGMIAVGIACGSRRRLGSLRGWTLGGCIGSAVALASLVGAAVAGAGGPLQMFVIGLGLANGTFAVAAIASMMESASAGEPGHAGVRMGLWGAAQAIAFAFGGIFGTAIIDVARTLFASSAAAYALVFSIEALLFLTAASFAAKRGGRSVQDPTHTLSAAVYE